MKSIIKDSIHKDVKMNKFNICRSFNIEKTLEKIIQNENNLQGISAAVLIPGEGQWAGVNGFSHNGNPISSDMEFGIASNTKLFTGVLMLKLIENNLFNLDDSIYQFIPS